MGVQPYLLQLLDRHRAVPWCHLVLCSHKNAHSASSVGLIQVPHQGHPGCPPQGKEGIYLSMHHITADKHSTTVPNLYLS